MIVGITGANGFLGRYLTQYLTAAGYEVLASVRSEVAKEYFKSKNVNVHVGDLQIRKNCDEFTEQVDCLIHLAHSSFPLSGKDNTVEEIVKNISPSLHLLESIRQSRKKVRLIYASSGGTVYSSRIQEHYKESDPCDPHSTYGIQKYTIENYILHYAQVYGLEHIILRLSNPYGVLLDPQRKQGLIGVALSRILKGEPIQVYGDPCNVRDYVHLDDMGRAFERAIVTDNTCEIYNIGSGVGYSVDDVLSKLESFIGMQVRREYIENSTTTNLCKWSVLNIDKAKETLGWVPSISLDTGLKALCESTLRTRV